MMGTRSLHETVEIDAVYLVNLLTRSRTADELGAPVFSKDLKARRAAVEALGIEDDELARLRRGR